LEVHLSIFGKRKKRRKKKKLRPDPLEEALLREKKLGRVMSGMMSLILACLCIFLGYLSFNIHGVLAKEPRWFDRDQGIVLVDGRLYKMVPARRVWVPVRGIPYDSDENR